MDVCLFVKQTRKRLKPFVGIQTPVTTICFGRCDRFGPFCLFKNRKSTKQPQSLETIHLHTSSHTPTHKFKCIFRYINDD